METIREKIHLTNNRLVLDLPSSYSGKDVEVTVLPVLYQKKHNGSKKKRFHGLFDNPLKVKKLKKIKREELYDR